MYVSRALGHGANRGKVYYLHPELFKVLSPLLYISPSLIISLSPPSLAPSLPQYACDGDDKTWLYENKYLPVHGGKVCVHTLWLYDDVIVM